MFSFNDALKHCNIDPAQVLIMRHRPPELELRRQLPWLAGERHDVFNAYQAVQPKAETAMQRANYLASFIGQDAGTATFVGLYTLEGHRRLGPGELGRMPEYQVLQRLGLVLTDAELDGGQCYFELALASDLKDWSGRLVCTWSAARSWVRWAKRNTLQITALTETSRFAGAMPNWDEIVVSLNDLETLPRTWQAALSQWRGIYFILDETDGQGYVGSAYGRDNIYGRWRSYASNGHGGNVGLKDRAHNPLRFSILQRVSPDMDAANVMALEASWKRRLHTRDHGLNHN